MELSSNDLYKEKLEVSEQNNEKSDLPPELNPDIFNEKEDNDIKFGSFNKNTKPKEEKKIQKVMMLQRYIPRESFSFLFLDSKIYEIITIIILSIYLFFYFGISIADIVIQFINPNGINVYLIEDLSLTFAFFFFVLYLD